AQRRVHHPRLAARPVDRLVGRRRDERPAARVGVALDVEHPRRRRRRAGARGALVGLVGPVGLALHVEEREARRLVEPLVDAGALLDLAAEAVEALHVLEVGAGARDRARARYDAVDGAAELVDELLRRRAERVAGLG